LVCLYIQHHLICLSVRGTSYRFSCGALSQIHDEYETRRAPRPPTGDGVVGLCRSTSGARAGDDRGAVKSPPVVDDDASGLEGDDDHAADGRHRHTPCCRPCRGSRIRTSSGNRTATTTRRRRRTRG
jgi:hypothetical protein